MEPLTRFKSALLVFETDPSEHTFSAAMAAMEAASSELKELRAEYNRLAVEFVESRGDVVIGESRYYVGTTKTYKPLMPNAETAEALLNIAGGDIRTVCDCLASSCWKPGTVRTLVDDDAIFEGLFETVTETDVKTGKPKKEVKKAMNP